MNTFIPQNRQTWRRNFQPSRILLAIIPIVDSGTPNVVTLSFNMYCSYKPNMIAISIQNKNASFFQIRSADKYSLAVPGEALAKETLFCGTTSYRDCDKVAAAKLKLKRIKRERTFLLEGAIGNLLVTKTAEILTGDHITVIGEVRKFLANRTLKERPLLSIGPITTGYEILARKGIHRIGVVKFGRQDGDTA